MTEINKTPIGYMICSSNPWEIHNFTSICTREGKTIFEKLGIFDTREKAEAVVNRIPEKTIGYGTGRQNEPVDMEL